MVMIFLSIVIFTAKIGSLKVGNTGGKSFWWKLWESNKECDTRKAIGDCVLQHCLERHYKERWQRASLSSPMHQRPSSSFFFILLLIISKGTLQCGILLAVRASHFLAVGAFFPPFLLLISFFLCVWMPPSS